VQNHTRCLILRGVSDLVSETSGEAYQDKKVFLDGTQRVMQNLLGDLMDWVNLFPYS
jgi:hypothetical protein